MNRNPAHDTREHLLATGEQLCLQRGFTGMGLSELLKTAEVPKGSFYHYFRSKEAFGVVMLERYYAAYNQRLQQHFDQPGENAREKLLGWYQEALTWFYQHSRLTSCLTVKLSAEVCDLSEDMRGALDKGAAQIIAQLAHALEKGRAEKSLAIEGDAFSLAQTIYALWLGASLQAKISRSATPMESALVYVNRLLTEPAC